MLHINTDHELNHFNPLHGTPIKKSKELVVVEPNTAESPEKIERTLNTVDADELYLHFDEIIKVS